MAHSECQQNHRYDVTRIATHCTQRLGRGARPTQYPMQTPVPTLSAMSARSSLGCIRSASFMGTSSCTAASSRNTRTTSIIAIDDICEWVSCQLVSPHPRGHPQTNRIMAILSVAHVAAMFMLHANIISCVLGLAPLSCHCSQDNQVFFSLWSKTC